MKNKIQEELDNHIQELNEDGLSYKIELTNDDEDNTELVSDLIRDADLENIDFNIGFEQGYMRGLEVALSLCDDEDYEMIARENKNMAEALSKLNYTPEQISDICNGAI
jgi:hypothetical protein